MKKRLLSILLVLVLVASAFCMVGCGGGADSNTPEEDVGPQYQGATGLKVGIENNGASYIWVDLENGAGVHQLADKFAPILAPADDVASIVEALGTKGQIILVNNDGGDAALAARDALVEAGVKSSRLFILTDGFPAMEEFPDFFFN